MQSGKPVGVFRTHADAPRVLIANSNLVPHWATWDHFHELDRKGLMMYGQMTAGSWIYIGSAGHRAGHVRDLRRDRPPALRRRPFRQMDPDRRSRRHGRRAAARRDHGRRLAPRRRMPALAHRDAPAHRLSRSAGSLASTRRSTIIERSCRERKPVSVGLLGNAAESLPRARAPRRAPRRRHRPDLGA